MISTAVPADFQPRRAKARLRLGIPANLLTIHGRISVTLRDLSESGARLDYDGDPIRSGVLEWLRYEAFGLVVRHADGELGLRFDEPITQECVLDTRELLPALLQGEDQVTTFAREWVDGRDGQRVSAHISGLRAEVLRHRASASDFRVRNTTRQRGLRSWLHSARPFLAGGAVVGLAAGYYSNFL